MNNNDLDQFSFYLDTLNIKMNEDVLVLTSHYYYNIDELSHVHAIVHTKELNKVNNLQGLMSNVMKNLSNGTKFIGCFIDNKFYYKSRVGYWLFHFFTDMNNKYMSRKQVINLFKKFGLQVIDITEINGITYFCIKNH